MTREPKVGDKIKMKSQLGTYSNQYGYIIGKTTPASYQIMLPELSKYYYTFLKIRFDVITKDLYQYNI